MPLAHGDPIAVPGYSCKKYVQRLLLYMSWLLNRWLCQCLQLDVEVSDLLPQGSEIISHGATQVLFYHVSKMEVVRPRGAGSQVIAF